LEIIQDITILFIMYENNMKSWTTW